MEDEDGKDEEGNEEGNEEGEEEGNVSRDAGSRAVEAAAAARSLGVKPHSYCKERQRQTDR